LANGGACIISLKRKKKKYRWVNCQAFRSTFKLSFLSSPGKKGKKERSFWEKKADE